MRESTKEEAKRIIKCSAPSKRNKLSKDEKADYQATRARGGEKESEKLKECEAKARLEIDLV